MLMIRFSISIVHMEAHMAQTAFGTNMVIMVQDTVVIALGILMHPTHLS